ncbi:MAG: hypothetical protein AAF289_16215 [Cyanobacteria bacterium P01_A01_bin.135]
MRQNILTTLVGIGLGLGVGALLTVPPLASVAQDSVTQGSNPQHSALAQPQMNSGSR